MRAMLMTEPKAMEEGLVLDDGDDEDGASEAPVGTASA